MNVKGTCVFFHVSLLLLCRCCFGGTERTHEINCQRGYGLLKPTDITCLPVDRFMTCTWLLGIQYDNSSVIDTSCNYIRTEESVRMYFSQNISSGSNGYESWTPCQIQDPTSCSHLHDSDEFYVMVIVNNNKLNTCTGFSTEKIKSKVPEYMDHEIADMKHVVILAIVCTVYGFATFAVGILMCVRCHKSKPRKYLSLRSYGELDEVLLESHPSEKQKISRQHKEVSAEIVPAGYLGLHTKTISDEVHDLKKITRLYEPNWTECINQKSVVSAGKLLRGNKLPTNDELQSISRTFGRKSDTLRDTCAKICETIEERIGSVTNVWPAYTVSNDKIVFVVESMSKLSKTCLKDYEIHSVNCRNTLEKEGENVMLKEKEILASYHKYDVEKFKQLKQSISKNAERLMDKHSNINVISPSVVKSVGYSPSRQPDFIETLCISIYVKTKVRDLIPLEEEPIPADIGGFPTDILEGKFSFFGKRPNDFHKTVKMGCGIHAGLKNEKGDTLGGTLGGFVQHRTHGLCCVTCAHLILSLAELQKAKAHGYLEYAENTGKRVYQPVSENSAEFGRLVSAAYKEGLDGSPGVEVALIKVLYRHPTSGSFPQPDAGSDHKKAFEFNSGNVNDATLLRPMTEVYKFGMSTGPTVGRLGLSGAAVLGGSNHINDPNFGIRLYNQLEIYPEENSSFAKVGDSGALVLIGHTRPNTAAAIGIVEGGLANGKVLVTPLFDALEALKCPQSLKRFEDSSDSGVQVDMPQGAESANDNEDMDCS